MLHRVLIIGTGSIGERHVRCFQRTGRAEVGICEPREALRQRVTEAYQIRESFDCLEAALEQRWESAVVATPAQTHVALAMSLVQAGVAPLVEKPLAIDVDGIDGLVQTARQRKVVAGVAYVYRAHPALRAIREAIAVERFGRPIQVVVVAGQHFPTYRPAYRETYYTRHTTGGGAVQDALTHLLNAVEWMVGPATAVAADVAHLRLPGVEVEDTVHVLARHGDVLASYSLNQHQAPNEATITVICEHGTARCEIHAHRWRWVDQPETPWTDEPMPLKERDDWFTYQEGAWLDALEGKAPPLCTLAEGLQTVRTQRAVLASARDRQWVDVKQEVTA